MNRFQKKGTHVTHPERREKTLSVQSGIFAALRAFLPAPGSNALSGALAAFVLLAVLTPAGAQAAFTRPLLRQITETPAGPLTEARGLAVDAEDDPWVSEVKGPPYVLDRFDSAVNGNAFLEALEIEGLEPPEPAGLTPPEVLAIDNSTGHFYTTASSSRFSFEPRVELFSPAGTFIKRLGPFGRPAHVALDNSTEPSAGTVYVAHADENPPIGDGKQQGIEKFNSAGEPVNFTGCGAECSPYVSANQIIGTPTEAEPFNRQSPGLVAPGAIAVDSHGDIYAVVNGGEGGKSAVEEYQPTGKFLREFTGAETPGLGESHSNGGFGGLLSSLAVDPLSDHLLLAVERQGNLGKEAAIDEFDSSGHFLAQFTQTAAGHRLHAISALATDSVGDLYVLDAGSEPALDVFGPGLFDPTVRLGEATQRTATAAILNATVNPEALVNPEHSGLSECEFQYVTESEFFAEGFSGPGVKSAVCEPPASSIPADEAVHPVQAPATGLLSGTTYRYRLLATTAGALGGTALSEAFAFTAPAAPLVQSTSASNISSTFADLHARIDPLGAATTYHFEYLTQAEFEANGGSFVGPHPALSVPIPDVAIGSGGETGAEPSAVLQHIGALQPATAYRFRVLAANEVGPVVGPDATFTTLPAVSPGLPDARAYELLTPPDKEGATDMFGRPESNGEFENRDVGYPSESGDRFLLQTNAAFGSFPAAAGNAYVFSRTPSGWTSTSLASPALGLQSVEPRAFDSEMSKVVIADSVGSAASSSGISTQLLLGPPGGGPAGDLYTRLHTGPAEHPPGPSSGLVTGVAGASRDLAHLVLQSTDHTLAHAAEGLDPRASTIYESSGAGECSAVAENCPLLGLNPKGKPFECGAQLGQGGGLTHNAVSADGSRVIFTAPDPYMTHSINSLNNGGPGCWDGKSSSNTPQLYQRSGAATIEISKPEAGAEATRHPAVYVGAAADGSRVFFLTDAELTKDDAPHHDTELYEWRTQGTSGPGGSCAQTVGCLTRVSRGESGTAAAGVFAVPAISADGAAVYFLAFGQLAAGAPATGSDPQYQGESTVDLYRYDTESATTAYIATVGEKEYESTRIDPFPEDNIEFKVLSDIHSPVGLMPNANWETTPDGRYLLFASTHNLTGYDTTPVTTSHCRIIPASEALQNGHCSEVYHYDAQAASGDQLQCVSCNPAGAPPLSNATFASRSSNGESDAGPVRAISNDGSRVFFDTGDSLVPADANGAIDVYQWHDGSISLISSGTDPHSSFLLGSDPTGANVFFGTHARLVPADADNAGDLYDARICTVAEPCFQPPPNKEGLCEADACSHPVPAPNDNTPASLTYHGPGNEHPKPPAKKHHKKSRKHHKKSRKHGTGKEHHGSKHRRPANSNRRASR